MGFRVIVVRVREAGTDRLVAKAFVGVDEATRAAIEGEDVRIEHLLSQLQEASKVSRSYLIGGDPEPGAVRAGAEAGGHEAWMAAGRPAAGSDLRPHRRAGGVFSVGIPRTGWCRPSRRSV
jgi:hypothetical protein